LQYFSFSSTATFYSHGGVLCGYRAVVYHDLAGIGHANPLVRGLENNTAHAARLGVPENGDRRPGHLDGVEHGHSVAPIAAYGVHMDENLCRSLHFQYVHVFDKRGGHPIVVDAGLLLPIRIPVKVNLLRSGDLCDARESRLSVARPMLVLLAMEFMRSPVV
jgi:hypothetical protein